MGALKLFKKLFFLIPIAVVYSYALRAVEFSPVEIVKDVPRFFWLLGQMWPPKFDMLPFLVDPLLATIQMAILGTFFGALMSLPLVSFGTQIVIKNGLIYWPVRTVMNLIRAVPDLLYAIIFVATLGIGPLAGVAALTFFSCSIISKLTSESADNINKRPIEAIESTGAGKLQILRYAVMPQLLPAFIDHTIYVFELNIRTATIIGLIGAGGIGTQLITTLDQFWYDRAAAIILIIFALVIVIDLIGNYIRDAFMHGAKTDQPLNLKAGVIQRWREADQTLALVSRNFVSTMRWSLFALAYVSALTIDFIGNRLREVALFFSRHHILSRLLLAAGLVAVLLWSSSSLEINAQRIINGFVSLKNITMAMVPRFDKFITFSVDDKQIVRALNDGIIPDELRAVLRDHSNPLAAKASVARQKDNEWLMTSDDGQQEFLIRKVDEMLNIQDQEYIKFLWYTLNQMTRSIAIALVGTTLSFFLSFPLGFLASRRYTGMPPALALSMKFVPNAIRAFPELVLAIFFIATFGPGPLPGVLAIAIHSIGMLGKFNAEAVEKIRKEQVEALQATGASRAQVFRFGILPQVWPEFLALAIYRFEINVRAASVLGIVGAGGIGKVINDITGLRQWDRVGLCLIIIVACVMIIDFVSARIRSKLIEGPSVSYWPDEAMPA